MTVENYSYLKENRSVLKIPDKSHILVKNEDLYIRIIYFYDGTKNIWPSNSINKRVIVSIFSNELPNEYKCFNLSEKTTLLLDSDDPNYAHSWILKFNKIDKTISLKLEEYPNCGLTRITEDEEQGFLINY